MNQQADQQAPEFGGNCALGMRLNQDAEGSPDCTLERDGKLYWFKSPATRMLFKVLPNSAAKAQANWEARQS